MDAAEVKIGDVIVCKTFFSPHENARVIDWQPNASIITDEEVELKVLTLDLKGYPDSVMVEIPSSKLKSWEVTKSRCEVHGIPEVFIGKNVFIIHLSKVFQKKEKTILSKNAGCFCKNCNNFANMAESNQPDGSFLCYSCRTTFSWKF